MKDYKDKKLGLSKPYNTGNTGKKVRPFSFMLPKPDKYRIQLIHKKEIFFNLLILASFSLFFVVSYFWYQYSFVEKSQLMAISDTVLQQKHAFSSVDTLKNNVTPASFSDDIISDKSDKKEHTYPWKYIIIHHSAVDVGNVDSYNRYHQQKYHQNLLYHFIVGNGNGAEDGEIQIGERWIKQLSGGHVHQTKDEYNQRGIGICLVGNFEKKSPTQKQMDQLVRLVGYLMKRFSISNKDVLLHKEVNQTYCPGTFFPAEDFHKRLVNL